MFIQTLPIHMYISDKPIADALGASQRAVGLAMQHAHIPLYEIVAAQGARRTTSFAPLFQTMFQVNTVERTMLEDHLDDVSEPTVKVCSQIAACCMLLPERFVTLWALCRWISK